MKTIPTILLLACISLLLPSCKYEDGPVVSLRSKNGRITGRKKIVGYEVNGVDSMQRVDSAYLSTSCQTFGFDWLFPIEDGLIGCGDLTNSTLGSWEWADGKDGILLYMPLPRNGGITFPIGSVWTISKLSFKYLWLETSTSQGLFRLKFEKILE